jgi:hypothetical protein
MPVRIAERPIVAAFVADPRDSTTMGDDGAVRSVQGADVTLRTEELDAIWTPTYLERLARTYWKYLSRVSLGLIRVRYTDDARLVVLLRRPFVLLRFHAPEYELDGDRGLVRWRIRDGVLVAQRDHGHLEIEVKRSSASRPGFACAHVEVEVANFYPALSVWVARWFYANTQSRIHVLVTHGFLRSLARRELEESTVGRFAIAEDGRSARPEPHPPVTVGDTPWPLVIALAGSAAAAGAVLFRRWR